MERIAAILVTYNPDVSQVEASVQSIKKNGADVIVVDNSKCGEIFSGIDAEIIYLGENLGIAEAQNIGIDKAVELGYEWYVFFDQDSIIDENFLSKLTENCRSGVPYVAAPVFFDSEKSFFYQLVDIDKNGRRKKLNPNNIKDGEKITTVISSGTLMNNLALTEVGKMEASLFIDYVDTEWCMRAASKGIYVEIMKNAVMKHSIGDKSISLLCFNVPVHGPLRRYYRVRNGFALARMNHIPKRLAMREIFFSFIHQSIIILCEKNKVKYLKSYFWGVFDGIAGHSGKCRRKI